MPLLTFVKKIHEHDDVYSFIFEKPKSFRYNAGQHGIFFLLGLYRPHPFSLTSAPHQDFISVATKIREGSRFKQKMMHLKAGESVYFMGPVMNFTFDKKHHDHVFLAQGIGITPFHSMLLHAHETKLTDSITTIHVSNGEPTFKAITEEYSTSAFFPTSADEFQKIVATQNSSSMFYLSGSPKFIKSTVKALHQNGVSFRNMKYDLFLGY